jgi:hypothetical protein
VEAFVRAHASNLGLTAASFQSAIETISTNVRWVERNIEPLSEWLKESQI